MENEKNPVDAKGTTQAEAIEMLENLLSQGYSSNVEELALALGRETENVRDMLGGKQIVDDDLAMKMRNLAQQKNISIA